MSFLTVEDINTTIFSNRKYFWHTIDTKDISDSEDFVDVKCDFIKCSRTTNTEDYTYAFEIVNKNWTGGYYFSKSNGEYIQQTGSYNGTTKKLSFTTTEPSVKLTVYCNPNANFTNTRRLRYTLETDVLYVDYTHYTALSENHIQDLNIPVIRIRDNYKLPTPITEVGNFGVNTLYQDGDPMYLYVFLLKSTFKFNCTQDLIVGRVNKVALGANERFKPGHSLVRGYTPTISVTYGDQVIPVTYDNSLEDYVFELDLTKRASPGKVRFTVNVEANEVLNSSSSDVVLDCDYLTVFTFTDLKNACNVGGTRIVKLGANLQLSGTDFPINHDIKIIGDGKELNLNTHHIIVGANRQIIIEDLSIRRGSNSILQRIGSSVELVNCQFNNCTGLGSVVKCDIGLESLENPSDFTTVIKDCSFSNNDMCILHGGELTVTGCTVTGKISDKDYPYFLYQTDGTAMLSENTFSIGSNSTIESDIEFNSCIFICGETAQINGDTHTELQENNITSFLSAPFNNKSRINLTYYYELIEDNITLQSTSGFCHSVSGVDSIYKTGVNPTRS